MSEYEYKIVFLDEDGHVTDKDMYTATAENEEFARDEAETYADSEADKYGYADHEITLIDAH